MTIRDEWDCALDVLSQRDLATLRLVACAMHRRRQPLPRLRRFFVFTVAPPPIILGCRRVARLLPHPSRRAEDFLRPAQKLGFEFGDLRKYWCGILTGCALLAGSSLLMLFSLKDIAADYAITLLYILPVVTVVYLLYRWQRSGFASANRVQRKRLYGDLLIAFFMYDVTIFVNGLVEQAFKQASALTLVAELAGLLLFAHIFSALMARALANFARGFEPTR